MCPLLLSEWRVSLPLHGHEFFFADDALIGPLLIALPLDNSRSAAVFALCGSLSIPNLSLSPNGPFFPAAQHLPPSLFENLHIRALAVAMLRYFAQIPDNVRRKARIFHEPNSTDQLQISARGGAFDEMHAADIAQRCVPARASLLQSQINKILEQRFTKDLIIDLVLPDTDTTNPCPSTDSFLSIFTDPDDLTTTHDPCVRDSILSPHLPQSGSLQLDSHVTERRVRFFHELVSTEERYVDRLSHLIRDYVVPLRRLGTPSSSYDLKALFPAVLDQISQANSAFYNEIKDVDNELQLATLCSKHFGLFAPLYSKFLEASLDFEIHLENLLRQTRCKEYANAQKYKGRHHVGLKELLMEPMQRMPRYSMLLSNILALTPDSTTLHKTLTETINIAKRISTMERKDAEKVSSTFFALKNKIAGFPDSMISANRRLVNAVNAQCLLSPDFLRAESLPVTLVIFTDCIAILQRVGETVSGAAEILQCRFLLKPQGSRKTEKSSNLATSTSNKKDLIFRGWIKWEQAYFEYGHQQDSLWIRLSSEVVNSVVDHDNRWTRKPERKFIISGETNIDVEGFMQAITSAKLQCKTGKAETLTLNNHSLSAKFAVYRGTEQYKSEDVKSDIAIICESSSDFHISLKFLQAVKVGITLKFLDNEHYNLSVQSATDGVADASIDQIPLSNLRKAILEQVINIQRQLIHPYLDQNIENYLSANQIAIFNLIKSISQQSPMKSPSKVFRALSRPSSPIKVSTLLRRSKSKTERFTFPTHSKKPSGLVESTDGTKEQRIVQAIETFIQRLITDEELARYKLFQVQIENVQVVRDLCESLVKDPKRRWAVEGSPFPIALAAFVYLLDHIFVRKYGYVISTSTAVQLRQITGNLTGDEGKRTVLKEVLDGIGEDRWRVFSAFTKLLLAYLEKTENPPDKEATLVWAARLMAGPINKDIFLPVLNNIVDAGWHMLLNTTNKISRASSQMSSATSFSNLSGYSLSGRSSHTTSQSSLKSHRSLSVMSLLPSNASRSSSAVSNGLGHKRSATCGRSTSSLASLDEFGMRQTKVRSSTVALSESYFQSKLRIKTNIEETLSVKTSGKASHSKSLIETDTIRVVSPDESEIPIKSLNVSSNPISQNTKPLSSLRELTPTPSKSCSSKTTEGSQHAAARYDSKTPVDKVNHVSGRTTQKATINRGGDFPIIPRSTTQRRESKITEQSLSESSNISGRPSPSPRNLRPSSTAREAHLSRGQRLAKQQQEMREKRIHNTSA